MDVSAMTKKELAELIAVNAAAPDPALMAEAAAVRDKSYGRRVFVRGLIEFTNRCRNNCLYCGIRAANGNVRRYRLTKDEIMECVKEGRALGFSTFVLQGGEDMYYTDDVLSDIVYSIKELEPDCAVTLSVGERTRESYKRLRDAGADRYLLRHETASEPHYKKLHPDAMSFKNRIRCLYDLKELGYQVGAGFMVGSPYQTYEDLASDLLFLKELDPHMVGIGPFISQADTPFCDMKNGTLELTLTMLSLVRLMLPKTLLPATTALGTIDSRGREKGFDAGANVVMPNLSPRERRKDYSLYDNKLATGAESAEKIDELRALIENAGYMMDMGRGDSLVNIDRKDKKYEYKQ